jgi:hypothetical protein
MQAVAAEFFGYAGKFCCFLERRVSNSLFKFSGQKLNLSMVSLVKISGLP